MLSKTWNVIFNSLPVPVSLRKTSGLLFLVSWCFPAAQHQQMKALWMLPKTNKMHSTVAKHSIPGEMIRKSWDLSDLVRTSVRKTVLFWDIELYKSVRMCFILLQTKDRFSRADLHLFKTRFVIGWQNNRDGDKVQVIGTNEIRALDACRSIDFRLIGQARLQMDRSMLTWGHF